MLQFDLIFGRDSCQCLGKNPQTHPRRPQGLGRRLQIQRGEYLKQTLAALFFLANIPKWAFSVKNLAKIPKSEYLFNFYAKIPKLKYSVRNSYKFSETGIFVLPIFCQQKNRLLLEVQKTSCFNLFLFCFYSLCKNALGVLLAITACVKTLFVFLVKLALHCLRATFLANSWCWSFSICMSGRAWLPLQRLLCPSVRLHVLLFRSCRRWTW